jgi:hypothetical protein
MIKDLFAMTTEGEPFSGFAIPTSNYFRLPNCWTDITASITSLAEMKIVEYVARHTWGYQEYGIKKVICIDEFMYGRKRTDGSRMDKGTGLSKQSVIDGIRRGVADGYLEEEIDDTDRGRVHKSYTIRMSKNLTSGVQNPDPKSRPQMSGSLTPDVQNSDSDCLNSEHRSEKETSERHLKERETVANPQVASFSPSHSLLNSLTESQADFWTRFCAVSGADHGKLNKNAYALVTYFAPLKLTTDDIQSLYDLAYRHIREYAASRGIPEKDIKPPRLGNLKNVYPDWQAMRKPKEKPPEEHHHLSGTGEIRNSTLKRLAGNGPPPLIYAPLPTQKRNRSRLEKIDALDIPATLKGDHA